ncbi:MAG: hypothetical protein ACJ75B_07335 [Flavisolibacter sp.]
MKKIIGISFFLFFGLASAGYAQSTVDKAGHAVKSGAKTVGHKTAKGAKTVGHETVKGAKAVGHETAKGAKKVGNETAELASKGKSKVVDKTYKDKVGPDGQTIYINSDSKYYWVDKKGHKQYVTESQLRDKVKS